MNRTLELFEGHGVELEYMLVDRETLDVAPICDKVLADAAGEIVSDFDNGAIAWSNELALHVIEVKTNGPVARLTDEVVTAFEEDLRRIDAIAATHGARLLPTAMHPTMIPSRDTVLWPHDNRTIYATYDRVFGCQGHGWSNLQSCHLNLPFCGTEQFGRLHGAVRPLLPLLPALAASSPILEGKPTETLDTRLAVYARNQRRIPSIMGSIVPEPVYSESEYRKKILEPMYADIAPYDPEGELADEWLNSRGAIARFDRSAIEIRLLDVQETPAADIAIAALTTEAARALVEERWVSTSELQSLDTTALRNVLAQTIVHGDTAIVEDGPLLRALGRSDRRLSASEVWTGLYEDLLLDQLPPRSRRRAALNQILAQGPLARRVLRAVGRAPSTTRIVETYARLADCLREGRVFPG